MNQKQKWAEEYCIEQCVAINDREIFQQFHTAGFDKAIEEVVRFLESRADVARNEAEHQIINAVKQLGEVEK